ncbi:MAG: NAD(P)H-dependent oxidoreductase, partial [Bacteroidales bacterium]|nr:NAD(P)H-dependent oxidoreductase [Bacteroidales bacterium]
MNILVIVGSPKGKDSITLHTCLYLEKQFPELHFDYLYPGQRIKALEKDFSPALDAIRKADVLLFCYPVYTFLVPYQLHRFIELMKASGEDFSGKTATQVTTSKHFYDITAHRFIRDNCADMGLCFLDGLSADMDDILKDSGRKQARDWMNFVLWQMGSVGSPERSNDRKAVVVADLEPGDARLKEMVDRFVAVFPYPCDVINIREFPFQGGCLSCFSCAATGK